VFWGAVAGMAGVLVDRTSTHHEGELPFGTGWSTAPKCKIISRDFRKHLTDEEFIEYVKFYIDSRENTDILSRISWEYAKNPKLGWWGEHIVRAWVWLGDNTDK